MKRNIRLLVMLLMIMLAAHTYTMMVSFHPTYEDKGKIHRSLRITTGEHHTWWRMILKLQAFGMKMKEGYDNRHDLKGKGLFAGTGTNSIAIGY